MSNQSGREVSLTVRIPDELHDLIKRTAEREDCSMARIVRLALRQYTNRAWGYRDYEEPAVLGRIPGRGKRNVHD